MGKFQKNLSKAFSRFFFLNFENLKRFQSFKILEGFITYMIQIIFKNDKKMEKFLKVCPQDEKIHF